MADWSEALDKCLRSRGPDPAQLRRELDELDQPLANFELARTLDLAASYRRR